MGRKTKGIDFDVTKPSMGSDEPHFSGLWEVFEGYEIRVPGDGAPYLEAVGEMKKSYRPLADTPFLFLAFARLADQPATEEVLRSWIEEYGLLGVHYDDGRPYLPVYYPEPATPPLMYDTQGGPGENLMYFWASAQEANRVLSLYEAALNRDEEKLERLLGGPDVVQRITKNYLGDILAMSLLTQTEMPRDQIMSVADLMVDKALMRVWHVVQDRLSSFAYPTINHELPLPSALPHFHKGAPLSPHRLGASWGFRNLIGAMYLQFYWLITSRADIKRCKYCGRVISLAPPTTPDGKKGRKPRSDKEYCNKSCQQNYDYHKRRKHINKS